MNHVVLLGRPTKDIELKYVGTNNTLIANFVLAVNRQFKKEGEERQADFISCKAFNTTAETLSKYVTKGQQILIGGRINTGKFEKDGVTHYTTDIIVESFYFADGKKSDTNSQKPSNESGFASDVDDSELPF